MPLQIWEGTVLDINRAAGVMQVLLDAKIGQMPRHTGEIDLEWVDDQDQDLVRPGAVFYLTLFKRTKRERRKCAGNCGFVVVRRGLRRS